MIDGRKRKECSRQKGFTEMDVTPYYDHSFSDRDRVEWPTPHQQKFMNECKKKSVRDPDIKNKYMAMGNGRLKIGKKFIESVRVCMIYLFIYLSIYLSIYRSAYLFISVCVYIYKIKHDP